MSDRTPLSDLVAEEIRAALGRRNMNKSALARRLDVSHTWVTNRLAGHQEISLNEMQSIAEALDVTVAELLPRALAERLSANTHGYQTPTEQPMLIDARRTHPIGRPVPPQRGNQQTALATRTEPTVSLTPFTANPVRL